MVMVFLGLDGMGFGSGEGPKATFHATRSSQKVPHKFHATQEGTCRPVFHETSFGRFAGLSVFFDDDVVGFGVNLES